MWHIKKKQTAVTLPDKWTQELWGEVCGNTGTANLFIGIETCKCEMTLAYSSESAQVSKSYGGFIGGEDGSRKRMVRASLSFTRRSDNWGLNFLPTESNGWASANDHDYFIPTIGIVIFATEGVKSAFDDIYIRSKLSGEKYLRTGIRGDIIKNENDQPGRFIGVINITNFYVNQHMSLGGPISPDTMYTHSWGF